VRLILITNVPDEAHRAARSGVDMIMVDLEKIGKSKRQSGRDTLISDHSVEDISAIVAALEGTGAETIVRVNPLHIGSEIEIDEAIGRGAKELMLPMFRHHDEVSTFAEYVNGRARITLLLETSSALARLKYILSLPFEFGVHVGLNDLHKEMRIDFMFELLSGGVLDYVSEYCYKFHRSLGIGGIARTRSETAVVPASLIAAQHLRLGSTSVILSRDWRSLTNQAEFEENIRDLRSLFVGPSSPQVLEQFDATVNTVSRPQVRNSGLQ